MRPECRISPSERTWIGTAPPVGIFGRTPGLDDIKTHSRLNDVLMFMRAREHGVNFATRNIQDMGLLTTLRADVTVVFYIRLNGVDTTETGN